MLGSSIVTLELGVCVAGGSDVGDSVEVVVRLGCGGSDGLGEDSDGCGVVGVAVSDGLGDVGCVVPVPVVPGFVPGDVGVPGSVGVPVSVCVGEGGSVSDGEGVPVSDGGGGGCVPGTEVTGGGVDTEPGEAEDGDPVPVRLPVTSGATCPRVAVLPSVLLSFRGA